MPWARIGLVALAVAAGHLVLFLMLTGDARREIDRIARAYDLPTLASATQPGPAPAVGTEDYATWRDHEARWQAARAYGKHRDQRDLIGHGLLASFLLQAGITGWLLMRIAARAAKRRARAA